jgi:hypothetical protein
VHHARNLGLPQPALQIHRLGDRAVQISPRVAPVLEKAAPPAEADHSPPGLRLDGEDATGSHHDVIDSTGAGLDVVQNHISVGFEPCKKFMDLQGRG